MSFEVLAPHYRWMELVLAGNKLQRCRTAFLGQVSYCREVLILGEGNGRFLCECYRAIPEAHITCVDSSAGMLAVAQRRLSTHGSDLVRVEFVTANALTWKPPRGRFDLVVTHFFLDCFGQEQLNRLIPAISSAMTPAAQWLLADFQVPPAGLTRYRALVIHQLMYWFFCVVTRLPARHLSIPDGLLYAHRFALRRRQVSEWGLLHSDLWARCATESATTSQVTTTPRPLGENRLLGEKPG